MSKEKVVVEEKKPLLLPVKLAARGAQNAHGSARNAQARRTGARAAPAPKARWPATGFGPAFCV